MTTDSSWEEETLEFTVVDVVIGCAEALVAVGRRSAALASSLELKDGKDVSKVTGASVGAADVDCVVVVAVAVGLE